MASKGKEQGFVEARSKVAGGKGLGSFAFAYTQNTLRVYAEDLAPVRKISSPVRKIKRLIFS